MHQQRPKQQTMVHQSLYHHPGLLAASQIEPILTGNLPPDFDSSTCRSVYVGNIHPRVTDSLLQEVSLVRVPLKASYGFVDYFDRRSAAIAILSLNDLGSLLKSTGHMLVARGRIHQVTDATLFACFSVYPSCSDARVLWDQKTGHSQGFGFVSFRNQQEVQGAINDLNGKWLGNRQIRCSWATKGANNGNDDKQNSDSKSVLELTNGTSEECPEKANDDNPDMNPQYTTVYVGNLAPEVTSVQLHHLFHALGPGTIEDVWVQRDKGFGFIRYSTHDEAALAIHIGNARVLSGKPIKWSWGSKPTPLPPPAAAHMPVFSAYEGQMAEQDGWCSCSYESTWSACAEAGSHGNGCPCG